MKGKKRFRLSEAKADKSIRERWHIWPTHDPEFDGQRFLMSAFWYMEAIQFWKWWRQEGADLFARWLWKNRYGDAFQRKSGLYEINATDFGYRNLYCCSVAYYPRKRWRKRKEQPQPHTQEEARPNEGHAG